MRFARRFSLFVAIIAALAQTGYAVTLDWDGQTWVNNPDGTPAPNSYEIDITTPAPTSRSQPRNKGPSSKRDIGKGTPQTPAVGRLHGGWTRSELARLAINLANNTQSVTITLSSRRNTLRDLE